MSRRIDGLAIAIMLSSVSACDRSGKPGPHGADAAVHADGGRPAEGGARVDGPGSRPAHWVRTVGGAGREDLFDLAIGETGQVHLLGTYTGSLVIDGANGSPSPVPLLGSEDVFLAALDPANGAGRWVRIAGTDRSDSPGRMLPQVNRGGDVVIEGFVSNGPAQVRVQANGGAEFEELRSSSRFRARYGAGGTLQYARDASLMQGGFCRPDGRMLLLGQAGKFDGVEACALASLDRNDDFPPTATAPILRVSPESRLLGYWPNGKLVLLARLAQRQTWFGVSKAADQEAFALVELEESGSGRAVHAVLHKTFNVLQPITGALAKDSIYAALVVDEGPARFRLAGGEEVLVPDGVALLRYDLDGELRWVHSLPGVSGGRSTLVSGPDGSVWVSVSFLMTAEVPAFGVKFTAAPGTRAAYVLNLTKEGALISARAFQNVSPVHLAPLPDGDVLFAAGFEKTTRIGVGEPWETELTAKGAGDIFVARFRP